MPPAVAPAAVVAPAVAVPAAVMVPVLPVVHDRLDDSRHGVHLPSVLLEICTSRPPGPAPGSGAGQGHDPVGDGGRQVAVMGEHPVPCGASWLVRIALMTATADRGSGSGGRGLLNINPNNHSGGGSRGRHSGRDTHFCPCPLPHMWPQPGRHGRPGRHPGRPRTPGPALGPTEVQKPPAPPRPSPGRSSQCRVGVLAGRGACDTEAEQRSFTVQLWSVHNHRGIARWC
jgi:hypothetical protein